MPCPCPLRAFPAKSVPSGAASTGPDENAIAAAQERVAGLIEWKGNAAVCGNSNGVTALE